jgi:tRNA(Arg) A34 adenosine deaminase TadA
MPSQEFNETMQLALDLAAKASQQGDVPVGAIVLNSDGDVVARFVVMHGLHEPEE